MSAIGANLAPPARFPVTGSAASTPPSGCGPCAADLSEVALIPGEGGVFRITVDGDKIWERKADGGFPDIAILEQRVRDRVAPGRALGHAEKKDTEPAS
ncbi:SelT/SelW/SelH family protein [Nocardia tengchongensis]|uniref:SelT/SelW/SelH family protein n=1 Tax=Nocardia tengchongensis TaxID=2055889 RepID=UPI003697827D